MYSLDTSALITPWRDTYPPRRFKGFWERYEELIDSGRAFAVDEVAIELKRRDDELAEWIKLHPSLFVPLEADIQLATIEALRLCERMVGNIRGRNGADPFVIGLAKARGLTVVTMEKATNSLKRPKIPDVCNEMGVPCIDVIGLMDREQWEF
ncbi:DUF4411 family protein [Streptomyces chartreusis]|uniref:DUF4411 family protein n=1 Tax=Streptomyces chartreusis TaxID=1969 RepID=UPI003715EFBC